MNGALIRTLFLDLGGVLLTNGWDRQARKAAADHFRLNREEFEERHHLTFSAWEVGKLSFQRYLDRVVFHTRREFEEREFIQFMFAQSQPHQDMIDLVRDLKNRYHLRVATITNDPREIVEYRISKFSLRQFIDFFIASCFVHCRKPDSDIFQVAMDIAQADFEHSVYIEDRAMFVEAARDFGLTCVHHIDTKTTREALMELGLT